MNYTIIMATKWMQSTKYAPLLSSNPAKDTLFNAFKVNEWWYYKLDVYLDTREELGFRKINDDQPTMLISQTLENTIETISEEEAFAFLESRVFNGEWLWLLLQALSNGDIFIKDVMEYLVQHEEDKTIDLNRTNEYGQSIMQFIIYNVVRNDTDIAQIITLIDKLVTMGMIISPPGITSSLSVPPLMLAVVSCRVELVDYLINVHGLDARAKMCKWVNTCWRPRQGIRHEISVNYGDTLLDLAEQTHNLEMIHYIKGYFTKPTKSAARF